MNSASPLPPPPLLEATNLCVRFGPIRALEGVSLSLRAGEVQALLGENGAGKSTLIKCLSGVLQPSQGQILLEGHPIHPQSPHDAENMGIATVFQEVGLIPHLSIAENICLGREPGRRFFRHFIDWRAVRTRAAAAMSRLGLTTLDIDRELGTCSVAVQQMVAIARALDVQAKVLILDEPTSSLDRGECARLLAVIRQLRSQGLGIIFISHFLDQVEAIADRITILRDGSLIGSFEAATLTRPRLVSLMVGRDFDFAPAKATANTEPAAATAADNPGTPNDQNHPPSLLTLRGIGRTGMLEHVDADIAPGEVVGLAGLLGSGRSETAQLIFGAESPTHGTMTLRGVPTRFSSPRAAIAKGIGLLPENRKTQGLFPSLSVLENLVVSIRARDGVFARLPMRAQIALAEEFVKLLGIKTPDVHAPISGLSGGNQQKVLLARWFAMRPILLILDEPTRGIDIAAKADVLRAVEKLRAGGGAAGAATATNSTAATPAGPRTTQAAPTPTTRTTQATPTTHPGTAVLFISSELEEVTRVCSRVVVLRDRRSIAQLSGSEITEQAVLAAVAQAS